MPLALFEFATDWLGDHQMLAWVLGGASLAMVVGAAIALPFVVVRIPADYFSHDRPRTMPWQQAHPAWRVIAFIGKNLLAAVLLLAGIVMLFTPGQGVLCMMLGLALLDLPGKRKFERWLVIKTPLFKTINALRQKYGHPPLEKPS